MIPLLDRYQFVTPASLAAVLDDLALYPAARPFAGGTDLMVVLEAGHLPPGRYVSLQNCRELLGIEEAAGAIAIGALVTYTEIGKSVLLAPRHSLLGLAARETGGLATQNRGTIGGNIANASPAADTPPALLAYDAQLELMSCGGTRRVPYADFHRGYKQMDLAPGELIARIHLPARQDGWRDYYRKVGTRRAQAIAKVSFAGAILMEEDRVKDVRIALGSVAPTVVRATLTEEMLRGKRLDAEALSVAEKALASEIAPIDDIRSNAHYRGRVAGNLLREFLAPG
ncbi:MAG: xanthine dehydrogenase family protein subunit M [Vicinamibacterales bacterium]